MTGSPTTTAVPLDAGRDRLVTSAFVRLAVADLAYFTATGVAIYALPLYVTGPIGSDKSGAGLAFGAFAVSALVLRPFAGRATDTFGRRPLLVGGALLCAVATLLTALAGDLTSVVALRLLLGVAEAGFFVASIAALVDLAPPSRMGEALSYNSLGLYLGLAFGPPLGELLVVRFGFHGAWIGAAGLAALAALVAWTIGETRAPVTDGDQRRPALIHWKAVPPALGFLASIVAIGGFLAFASLHADAAGLRAASLPLFVYGIVVVTCRIAFARVPDKVPSLHLGAVALLLMATGLAVVAGWTTPIGMILGVLLLAVGVSFSTPAFFSAIFATAAPRQRGSASGTASIFLDLGLGGGPIALGLVAEAAGIPWALAVGAGVAAVGAAWTVSLAARTRPAGSAAPID